MKVNEFIRQEDDYAAVVVNEYLVHRVFGGDVLLSEGEVVIGSVLTRKFRKALEELDARIQEMAEQLDKDMMERVCRQKLKEASTWMERC